MPLLNWPARILVAIGCGCLTTVGMQLVEAASVQQTARQTLARELATTAPAEVVHEETPLAPAVPTIVDGVVGRLEIPRLDLSTMVLEGDDVATLAESVGHVPGTAFPWDDGNAVLAGHRDTFFRPLKDLRVGDAIRVVTGRGTFEYKVIGTEVVDPDDVAVLGPTSDRALTLITCYPFVYVGHAPRRFVIHAR